MSREKEDSNWTDDCIVVSKKKKATSSQSRYIQTRARSKNTYSTTYFIINNYDQNTTTTTTTKQRICLPFPRTLPPSLPLKRCPPLLPPSDLRERVAIKRKSWHTSRKRLLKPPNPRRSSRKRKTCCRVVSTLPLEHSSPSAVNRSSSTKSKEHVRCTNFFFSSIGFYLKHLFRKAKTERKRFQIFFLFFVGNICVFEQLVFAFCNNNNNNNVHKKIRRLSSDSIHFLLFTNVLLNRRVRCRWKQVRRLRRLLGSGYLRSCQWSSQLGVDQATQKRYLVRRAVRVGKHLGKDGHRKSTVRGNG